MIESTKGVTMQTKSHRDISEVVTKNLLKSLLTGEDYMEETMEAIDKYETSMDIAKSLLAEGVDIEIIARCTNLPLEKIKPTPLP